MTAFKKMLLSGFAVILFFLFSCKSEKDNKPVERQSRQLNFYQIQDTLQKVNNALLVTDKERMDAYAERMGYEMKSSPSGLQYQIYKKGSGKKAEKGMIATYRYRIELLDGTLCYKSDSLNPKTVKIGQSGEEVGLDEALRLMHEGDKAHFLMPPYLAYGLLGDMKRIPARSVIYYHIELLKLKKKQETQSD